MKKITIYTLADKRPDFIPIQFETFKKFIKDEYEFIILNNAIDSKIRRNEIFKICEELNIKCIEVKKDKKFKNIGKQKAILWKGGYVNPNIACAYPIKWAWEEMCRYNQNKIFVIIDSDMFLCKDTFFNKEVLNYDASYMTQYRGMKNNRMNALVTYIWNGICIFNTDKIKNIKEINWDCGVVKKSFINGYAVDVGGYAHFWLEKNKLKIKHISEYAIINFIIKEKNTIWLECTLNGGYHYSFDYNFKDKTTSNHFSYETDWNQKDEILPHFPKIFKKNIRKKIYKIF